MLEVVNYLLLAWPRRLALRDELIKGAVVEIRPPDQRNKAEAFGFDLFPKYLGRIEDDRVTLITQMAGDGQHWIYVTGRGSHGNKNRAVPVPEATSVRSAHDWSNIIGTCNGSHRVLL
jgi:hypothetical protein